MHIKGDMKLKIKIIGDKVHDVCRLQILPDEHGNGK